MMSAPNKENLKTLISYYDDTDVINEALASSGVSIIVKYIPERFEKKQAYIQRQISSYGSDDLKKILQSHKEALRDRAKELINLLHKEA